MFAPHTPATTSAPKPAGKKGRLFDHPVLEALTYSSPQLIYGIYLPLLTATIWFAIARQGLAWPLVLAVFVAGVIVWTLAEYLLHRYVFHWVNDNPAVQRFHYLAHGFHHEYPRDTDHLFMPPLPSIVLASLFFGLFWLVMGTWALAFWPGYMVGYLGYATMHYAMHTVNMPPKLLRPLWKNHHLHHHKTPEMGFGVSSPLWDHVFGTVPNADAPKRNTPAATA